MRMQERMDRGGRVLVEGRDGAMDFAVCDGVLCREFFSHGVWVVAWTVRGEENKFFLVDGRVYWADGLLVFAGSEGRGVSVGDAIGCFGFSRMVDRIDLFGDRADLSVIIDGGVYGTAGIGSRRGGVFFGGLAVGCRAGAGGIKSVG